MRFNTTVLSQFFPVSQLLRFPGLKFVFLRYHEKRISGFYCNVRVAITDA